VLARVIIPVNTTSKYALEVIKVYRTAEGVVVVASRGQRISSHISLSRGTCAMLDSGAPNPSALGYRMPAEWEPHKQTWMGWPQLLSNWRDGAK
jgi:hypothetical protein